MINRVYLVLWENTWGEYHGCYGVYTTLVGAQEAQDRCTELHGSSNRIVRVELDPRGAEQAFYT